MRRLPAALVAGWALISLAWLVANPPFAAPDEATHYLRALSVGGGTLIGKETSKPPTAVIPQQQRNLDEISRAVTIPGRLAPPDAGCYIRDPRVPATCVDESGEPPSGTIGAVTYVGDYQPLPYLLPAALTHIGGRAAAADRFGRLGILLPSIALLALAVALLWDPVTGGASLLGAVVAVTPMALYCAGSLTGSGIEIAAGISLLAALLRVRRDGDCAPAWVLAAAGVSGAVLALSRSASPAWLVLAVLLFVALVGPRAAGRLLVRRRAAQLAGGTLVVALALNRVWESLYGPSLSLGLANGRQALRDGLDQLRGLGDQLVIGYGYLEFKPPLVLSLGWLALVAVLVAAALAVAGRRERIVLAATAAAAPLIPVVLYVVYLRHTGFGVQGRHVLPIIVAVPLLAGELVRERWEQLASRVRRALLVGVPVLASAGQVVAWWLNERRAAVGVDGPLWFLGDAAWSPPVRWGICILLVVAGAALASAAVVAAGGGGGYPAAGALASRRPTPRTERIP